MSVDSEKESSWSGREKHPLPSTGEFSSPHKRSRPSLSQRLGLTDDSEGSEDEPYSPSDEQFPSSTEQKIIRQPQASLRESTLITTGQPSKAILDLLQDDDEDEEEEEEHQQQVDTPSPPLSYLCSLFVVRKKKRTVLLSWIQRRWMKSVNN